MFIEKLGCRIREFRFAANWLTAARFLFIPPMVYFYLTGQWQLGGAMMIASIVPDGFDGKYARYQAARYNTPLLTEAEEEKLSYWQRMNIQGVTHLGKQLDPFADKLVNILGLWLAGRDFIDQMWMIYLIITIELSLQFVVRPVKRWLGIGDAGANEWGQRKTQAEGWTAGFMPFWRTWGWPYAQVVFPVALTVSIAFGLMSIYGHFKPWFDQRRGTGRGVL